MITFCFNTLDYSSIAAGTFSKDIDDAVCTKSVLELQFFFNFQSFIYFLWCFTSVSIGELFFLDLVPNLAIVGGEKRVTQGEIIASPYRCF